jgi:hypothetical protein
VGQGRIIKIELVVHSRARNLIDHARTQRHRKRRGIEQVGGRARDRAEIEIEVLDFARPIAAQMRFNSAAGGPAGLAGVMAKDLLAGSQRIAVGVADGA